MFSDHASTDIRKKQGKSRHGFALDFPLSLVKGCIVNVIDQLCDLSLNKFCYLHGIV